MSDTRTVVESFFARGRANDPSIVELFAEDFEFFAPGDPAHFPWAGRHTHGGADLVKIFESVWSSRVPGSGQIEKSTLIVEGEHAAWIGEGVSHEMNEMSHNKGQRFTLDVAMHFEVHESRIVRLFVIEDMTGLAQAYGFS